jgi:hypothetical protein
LYQVIAYEPKSMALRKDGGVFICRAVLEAKNQVARHPIAVGDVCYFTFGESATIQRA